IRGRSRHLLSDFVFQAPVLIAELLNPHVEVHARCLLDAAFLTASLQHRPHRLVTLEAARRGRLLKRAAGGTDRECRTGRAWKRRSPNSGRSTAISTTRSPRWWARARSTSSRSSA